MLFRDGLMSKPSDAFWRLEIAINDGPLMLLSPRYRKSDNDQEFPLPVPIDVKAGDIIRNRMTLLDGFGEPWEEEHLRIAAKATITSVVVRRCRKA